MKYAEEARCGTLVKKTIKQIIQEIDPGRDYCFLDFCSCHTHPIQLYNINTCLPDNVKLLNVSKESKITLSKKCLDNMICLAKQPDVICCGYPEILVNHGEQTYDLLMAKAEGADIRVVYNIEEAVNLAKIYPARHVIFLATGFEADMLQTARALQKVKEKDIKNFLIYTDHKTALQSISNNCSIDTDACTGFLLPVDFHGAKVADYHALQLKTKSPVVISGFEPIDILQSLLLLIRQNNANRYGLIMQHYHTMAEEEKVKSRQLLQETFISQANSNANISVQADFLPATVQFADEVPVITTITDNNYNIEQDNVLKVAHTQVQ